MLSRRRLAAVGAAAAAAFALVLSLDDPGMSGPDTASTPAADPGPGGAGPPFAYITERQLVVMRGPRVVARVPRIFDASDRARNKVVWTNDGRFVVFLSDAGVRQRDPARQELVAVDALTGQVRTMPCPRCTDLVPAGMNHVVTSSYGDRGHGDEYASFRLGAADGDASKVELPLAYRKSAHAVQLLAGLRRGLVTSQSTFVSGRYGVELTYYSFDGRASSGMGVWPSNDYLLSAARQQLSGPGTVAIAFRVDPGACLSTFPTYLFREGTGKPAAEPTGAAPPEPAGVRPGANGGIEMHDLWWGRDGALYATVSGWTCDHTGKDENAEKRPAAGSSVWKLVDDRWVRDPMTSALGDGPITMARHLGEGEVAVLSIPDCVGRVRHPRPEAFCRTGPLYRVVGGVRTKVADGVIALSAGPAGPRVPPGRGGRAGQVSR